jgi:hypothetical protein
VRPLVEFLVPPPRFLGECPDRRVDRDPQTREQTDQHIESFVAIEGREVRPGQTSFEEHGVGVSVVIDQLDGPIPCPGIESLCLVIALSMWPLDLEHHVCAVCSCGRQDESRLRGREWLTHCLELPAIDTPFHEMRKSGEPVPSVITGRDMCQTARDVRLRPP